MFDKTQKVGWYEWTNDSLRTTIRLCEYMSCFIDADLSLIGMNAQTTTMNRGYTKYWLIPQNVGKILCINTKETVSTLRAHISISDKMKVIFSCHFFSYFQHSNSCRYHNSINVRVKCKVRTFRELKIPVALLKTWRQNHPVKTYRNKANTCWISQNKLIVINLPVWERWLC